MRTISLPLHGHVGYDGEIIRLVGSTDEAVAGNYQYSEIRDEWERVYDVVSGIGHLGTDLSVLAGYPRQIVTVVGTNEEGDGGEGDFRWDHDDTSQPDSASVWGDGTVGRWRRISSPDGGSIAVASSIASTTRGAPSQIKHLNGKGGGQLHWDATSTATEDGATVFGSGAPGRWLREWDGIEIDTRWFGAVGNNSADDGPALQAALDMAATIRGSRVLLRGTLGRTFRTEQVLHQRGHQYVEVMGRSVSGTGSMGTQIIYDGADVDHAFELWANRSTWHDVGFRLASGVTVVSIVDIRNPAGDIATGLKFHHCRFAPEIGATTSSVRIGLDSLANCEEMQFFDCFFDCTTKGVIIDGPGGQSKHHLFADCNFNSAGWLEPDPEPGDYAGQHASGIAIDCQNGSFHVRGGAVQRAEIGFRVSSYADPCSVVGTDMENVKRVYDDSSASYGAPVAHDDNAAGGSSATNSSFTFAQCRIAIDGTLRYSRNLAADDNIVVWCANGNPVTFDGVGFVGASNVHAVTSAIKMRADRRGHLTLKNCALPNEDILHSLSFGYVTIDNCKCVLPIGGYSDDFENLASGSHGSTMGQYSKSLLIPWRPHQVRLLATSGLMDNANFEATGVVAKNFFGTVTISDTATEGAVTFARSEADANYVIVSLVIEHATGTPASASAIMKVGTKAVTGFTIALDAAPGSGNSVRVNWMIAR